MAPTEVRPASLPPTPPDGTPIVRQRLQDLVSATRLLTENVDGVRMAHRIALAAGALVEVDHVTVAIQDGGRVEQVVRLATTASPHVTTEPDPQARRLLDTVLRDARPLRAGGQGEEASFLGVPIGVRAHVLGGIALTRGSGPGFNVEDEEALAALAAAAAVAVEGARTSAQAHDRRRADRALACVVAALAQRHADDVPDLVAAQAINGFNAALVLVTTPGAVPGSVHVEAARGEGAAPLVDQVVSMPRPPPSAASSATPDGAEQRRTGDAIGSGPTIETPLPLDGTHSHSLWLCRTTDTGAFSATEIDTAADFASQAALAAQRARARADHQRDEAAAELQRIAADLHHHVIQRLFGTGLGLEAFGAAHPDHQKAITHHVEGIDAAIRAIRTAVFRVAPASHTPPAATPRAAADKAVAAAGTTAAAIDLVLSGDLTDDIVTVIRQALAKMVRETATGAAQVRVVVDDGEVTIIVAALAPPSARQDPQLTLRERQALELITEGLTNRQIGERLGLSEKTVKNYVSGLLAKLGMSRRTQAAVYGARHAGGGSNGLGGPPSRGTSASVPRSDGR